MINRDLHLSDSGMKVLIAREGSRTHLYYDAAGLPTIGVGHLLSKSELSSGKIHINGYDVRWAKGLSKNDIAQLLDKDSRAAQNAVATMVTVPLNEHQFDCLVSFVFNVGIKAFANSTLLKKLNAGQYDAVPAQLRRWIYAGGKPVLKNRRESECAQWVKGYV